MKQGKEQGEGLRLIVDHGDAGRYFLTEGTGVLTGQPELHCLVLFTSLPRPGEQIAFVRALLNAVVCSTLNLSAEDNKRQLVLTNCVVSLLNKALSLGNWTKRLKPNQSLGGRFKL